MSKTKETKKIDFKKIGEGAVSLLKANAGTLVGGITMIALGLACKKFDIPYQVLTEPFGGGYFGSKTSSGPNTKLVLIPNNSIEASMAAIYEGLDADDWDSTKETAARQIMSILTSRKSELQESTKTYAINLLRGIAEKSSWNSTKDHMNGMIAKIGKGEF